ncbi:MAG TPA: S41 family peptidase [Vicinamibacterales bacterium]|nr:S41 family peptidase [Vicinamibacterales bacterium]
MKTSRQTGNISHRSWLLIVGLSALTWTACGSKSPTAPSAPSSDFTAQFDSLWSTFDREYSYFVHKHIDWNALRTAYRPRALAAADQPGFIAVVREMLGHLHDLHVVIRDPGGATLPTYSPQSFTNWDRSVWQQYIARASWTQGQNDWGYGVLDGAPYITIGSWGANSIRSADFDAAFERFRDAPGMVVDVRMNPGGNDSLAFEIAGRFARASVVFGYVQFRNGPSHTNFAAPITRTLNPRGSWQYTGTVLLLIGRRCASSNESFIAAMGQLPNVTLVGDRTAGSTGNPGTFPLANGWSYTVSRWIERTVDNEPIEDVGLSPDVFVTAVPGDFAMGRDPVLEWALKTVPR